MYELGVVLGREKAKFQIKPTTSLSVVEVEGKTPLDLGGLMRVLGGTVKAGEVVGETTADELEGKLVEVLSDDKSKKVFAINAIGLKVDGEKLSRQVKKELTKRGVASRYLVLKTPLESAVAKQKNYIEIIIYKTERGIGVARVGAWQDIDDWSKRDTIRPGIDAKRGMLPPKLARMMINAAFPGVLNQEMVVYDPFCGSGTVLTEALELGIKGVGSDLLAKAVEDTNQNIMVSGVAPDRWRVFVSDAAKVDKSRLDKVDAIVTEPYLGPVDIRGKNIRNIIKGLSKMYFGAFKNLAKVLEVGRRVVVVTPVYPYKGVKREIDFVDRCEKFGYTRVAGPFDYHRLQALVQRQIFVLERK